MDYYGCALNALHRELLAVVTLSNNIRVFVSHPIKHELEDLPGCSVDVVADASLSLYLRDQVLRDAGER